MVRSLSFYVFVAFISASSGVHIRRKDAPIVAHLFSNATATKIGAPELERAFSMAYDFFNRSFDYVVRVIARLARDGLHSYTFGRSRHTGSSSKRSQRG